MTRAETLIQQVRDEIAKSLRILDREEKGTVVPLTRSITDKWDAQRNDLRLAGERLTQYRPAYGKEHCPRCFALKNRTVLLDLRYRGVPESPESVDANCLTCNFSAIIPVE